MANTFLMADGIPVGRSLAEPELVDQARDILNKARTKGVTFLLPTDVVVAVDLDSQGHIVPISRIPQDMAIYDIGTQTVERFAPEIAKARTIFWNGPMGVFEREPFAAGTLAIAKLVGDSQAYSVVGGGDSIAAIEQAGVADRISHVSTGGGASLEYVEGRELPGIAVLDQRGETA